MAKPLKRYDSQKEAIAAAKSRASTNCCSHYIYRVQADSEALFSVSTRLDPVNPPVMKVLYGGKVEQLEDVHVQPESV